MRILPFLLLSLLAGCGRPAPLTPADVQGDGSASALVDAAVTVQGVVTGDFQDGDDDNSRNLGGFFIQSVQPDDNPDSSEGLFVFDAPAGGPDVSPGDVVSVDGTVVEHFGETQLAASRVSIVGRAKPGVVPLALPATQATRNEDDEAIADLERFEGMLVRVPGELFVQDTYHLERFGTLTLSTEPREFDYTNYAEPDPAAYAAQVAEQAARTLVLDDGLAVQNARPPRYLSPPGLPGRPPRVGDAVADVEGMLRYSRGSGPHGTPTWRLQPTGSPTFIERNPRPPRPDTGGAVVVGSLNVLNYFTTVDAGEPACGPAGDAGCRGADSVAEFARQRARTAATIRLLAADIVGIMEIENNPRAALADLVGALNDGGDGDWDFVDTGTLGDDAIRVALLYRADRVRAVGRHAVLDASVDARFDDSRNRPVLAQTFAAAGGRFTVAVNHLKSKGSSCAEDGDPDRGDGQGNCNETRTRAARALADWLAGDPTGSDDPDVLILGDLNARLREDPLRALQAAGYVNLLDGAGGGSAYSFVFRGSSSALDHALASPSLARQVTGAAEWHINADEAPILDYNLDRNRDPALFDPAAPWRAADHDPLLVGLDLAPD